jgi:hypothetical protein
MKLGYKKKQAISPGRLRLFWVQKSSFKCHDKRQSFETVNTGSEISAILVPVYGCPFMYLFFAKASQLWACF